MVRGIDSAPRADAVDFVAVDVVAVDFVAVDFVAVDFVAVDSVAVDFVAVDFVAVDFVAVDVVAVDFVAVDSLTHPTMADPTPQPDYLLEPAFLRRLEQAALASRRALAGRGRGERRSPRRGTSVEFSDFRAYAPGDDLRYLDWNAYARLRRLFLKLFVEEEDLQVHVLVDTSASMDYGAPHKLQWARQAAAALGYLGLCGGDRVRLYGYADQRFAASRVFRGRGTAVEAFEWLLRLEAGGETRLRAGVDYLARSLTGPGIVFLLSDLLTPDWEAALGRLAVAGGEACVVQLMAPQEYSPAGSGDIELVDAETLETREITMGASVVRRYVKERDAFLASVRSTCLRYGFPYLFQETSTPVSDAILRSLRRLGVVQ